MPIIDNFPDRIQDTTCRIALFQGGLYDNGQSLQRTINTLYNNNTSKFIKVDEVFNMRYFNPITMTFGSDNSSANFGEFLSQSDFDERIDNIVNTARFVANEGKITLIRTCLNYVYNTDIAFDSIENQKNKLKYIINAFKKYDNVEIYLVGQSQGGLVNLETGIDLYYKVDKIISISTPYAPVYLASILSNFDFLVSLFAEKGAENYYKECVNTLSSQEYFTNLKNRWNSLTSRPELTAIVGTGCRIRYINGESILDSFAAGTFETFETEGFDGLVRVSEQCDINHASFVHLIKNTVPCYAECQYANTYCFSADNNEKLCDSSCELVTLHLFDFFSKLLESIFESINSAVADGEVNPDGTPKIHWEIPLLDMFSRIGKAGVYLPEDDFEEEVQYRDYEIVYKSPYNHGFIRYCPETISSLELLLR